MEESDEEDNNEPDDDLDLISDIPVRSNESNLSSSKTLDSFQFKTFAEFLAASRDHVDDFPTTEIEVSVDSDGTLGTLMV